WLLVEGVARMSRGASIDGRKAQAALCAGERALAGNPLCDFGGKADIKRRGGDVTVVATMSADPSGVAGRRATGAPGHRSARCAGSTLRRSATAYRKTGRLVIMHEGYHQCLEVRSGNRALPRRSGGR